MGNVGNLHGTSVTSSKGGRETKRNKKKKKAVDSADAWITASWKREGHLPGRKTPVKKVKRAKIKPTTPNVGTFLAGRHFRSWEGDLSMVIRPSRCGDKKSTQMKS